ncbi:LTA synthase family protein [Lacticaseibacillus salsurivasis]|uniref:LTA synthase family protein n=1 Tax=Lacticaseibacillus salsurivasis TaxID=3081441 RepID=UPI0030C72934
MDRFLNLIAAFKVRVAPYCTILTLCKIVISIALVVTPNLFAGTPMHAVLELGELFLVYGGVLVLGKHLRYFSYVLSSLLTLLIVSQEWVHLFSGSFVTKIMLDNVQNLKALGPALPKYITIVVLVVIVSFLPVHFLRYPSPKFRITIIALGGLFGVAVHMTQRTTAIKATWIEYGVYRAAAKTAQKIAENERHKASIIRSFEKSSVSGGIKIDVKHANVIVIFAEGTSHKTIDETAAKYPGLMPNLTKFATQTDNFVNYFNHTAPTYKGVRGQLFSSYQYDEGYWGTKNAKQIAERTDTPLIGVPQILRKRGYYTEFINPEPLHAQFTPYLKTLGFNRVISGEKKTWSRSGSTTYLSDEDNLKLLFNQASNLNKQGKRFFLGTYTLETHNGWSVKDNHYGNGKNAVLNKFHNLDTVFGEFLSNFNASELRKNTVLIFTTDHASYPSPDYTGTMDDTQQGTFISKIPLMIYYPGIKPETIDVKGRNSLALAPTVLDLLGISKVKNYFLGTSLFTNQPTQYENVSAIGESFYSTRNAQLTSLPASMSKLKNKILQYDSFSLNTIGKK